VNYLPLANILHHKLRSALSAMGIAIGIGMLITLAGLSRGTLNEVLDRWSGVDADLIVCPTGTDVTLASGGAISLRAADRIAAAEVNGKPVVEKVAPAYLARVTIGDNKHNVFGIRAADFPTFRGQARMLRGSLPDADSRFARWVARRVADAAAKDEVLFDVSPERLAELFESHGGLQMAIDTKLTAQVGADVGDRVYTLGHLWTITGVYESGAISRAVAPLPALQFLCGSRLDRATLLFVKLRPDTPIGPAAGAVRQATRASVVPTNEYQDRLMANFGIMYTYVDAVNAVALVIAFLFIMVTLYTMVLQRTREIAILKSMGAGPTFLLRQVLAESVLLTAAGCLTGIAASFAAGWTIERIRPDLTVTITAQWIGVALAAAVIGGLAAGLYPAWQAIRVDVAESLANIE